MRGVGLVLAALCAASCRAALEPFAAPAHFALESTVLLSDAARRGKEVGYKIRAALHVAPVYAAPPAEYLLHFRLESPRLLQRTKHVNAEFSVVPSLWDSLGDTDFYAHWRSGAVEAAYLPSDDLPDVLNYKKSLISLFQFQTEEGEYNETDISGDCEVVYETVSDESFRKLKRRCSNGEWHGALEWRRVTRYGVRGPALAGVWADEQLRLGAPGLGLKARCLHALVAGPAAGPGAPLAASLGAALGALPAALARTPLPLALPPLLEPETTDLEAALKEHREALEGDEPGGGGGAGQAAALLGLLPALRAARAPALAALLQRTELRPLRLGLCRALGLSGTRAAVEAVRGALQLAAPDPLPGAAAFLQAFALAAEPDEKAVLDVLKLARTARAPHVADGALLAAAGAGRAVGAVREQLARDLGRCPDERCRAVHVHALGNLRRADTVDLLLQHAANGSLAALDALDAAPPAALTHARLERLEALVLRGTPEGHRPLEVRAAALDLLARRRAPAPRPLLGVLRHLREPELRRLLWQRLDALAEEPAHAELRRMLRLLPRALGGWPARAGGGTSGVLARAPGWAAGGWAARLDSLQLARAGLLRRGRVRLQALGPGPPADLLEVELWTRGLEALTGAGADEPAAGAEGVAGGLALSVAGVRTPGVTLFDGQAELLGHVWAGTGSAATSVGRALVARGGGGGVLALGAGLALHAHWRAAAGLALDARALASLWSRSARAHLQLRAAGAARAQLAARPAWGALGARADSLLAARLAISADLDFYDRVAVCVRVDVGRPEESRNVSMQWSGARGGGVRRARSERRGAGAGAGAGAEGQGAGAGAEGRTLALGRPNDHECRSLRSDQTDD